MTKRLDRHDTILMARRQRQRAVANRPRIWLRVGQFLLAVVILVGVTAATVTGVVAATVFRRLQRIRGATARRQRH
jgi:hypothetical protein